MVSFERTSSVWSNHDATMSTLSQDSSLGKSSASARLQTSSSTSSLSSMKENQFNFRRHASENILAENKNGRSPRKVARRRSTMKSQNSSEAVSSTSSLNLRCDELLIESPIATESSSLENRLPKDVPSGQTTSRPVLGSSRCNITQTTVGTAFSLQRSSRKRPAPDSLLNHAQRNSVVADLDKAIHYDSRCLRSMLDSEPVLTHGFDHSLKSRDMRFKTVIWLNEVCSETQADLVVMPLAISYFDRFLAVQPIDMREYQALGAACLLLASKMKAPVPLSPKKISSYTDGGVQMQDILDWEIVLVNKLAWDLCTSTPFEFFDQVLARIPSLEAMRTTIAHAIYWIFKDESLAMQPPSAQAALSILHAVDDYVKSQARDRNSRKYCKDLVQRVEKLISQEFQYKIEDLREVLRSAIDKNIFTQLSERHISEHVADHVLQDEQEEVIILPSSEPVQTSFKTPADNYKDYIPRSVMDHPSSDLSPSLYTRTERMFSSAASSSDFYETPASTANTTKMDSGRRASDDSGFNSEVTTPEMAKTTTVLTTTYASNPIYASSMNQKWYRLEDSL